MNLPGRVFVDTSFLIALLNSQDADHAAAVSLQVDLKTQKTFKIISEYILLEFCDGLAKLRYRDLAVRSVELLKCDRTVEIIPASSQILHAAWQFFKSRDDKEWGLTDCTSFVIMRQLGLHVALTADRHFQQAGFQASLLQSDQPID